MTEDNGPDGFYRYIPNHKGQLHRGGKLQMLGPLAGDDRARRGACGRADGCARAAAGNAADDCAESGAAADFARGLLPLA